MASTPETQPRHAARARGPSQRTSAGASATEAQVIARCKQRLGSVKAPKSVDFRDELPRDPSGWVLKRAIRDRYVCHVHSP